MSSRSCRTAISSSWPSRSRSGSSRRSARRRGSRHEREVPHPRSRVAGEAAVAREAVGRPAAGRQRRRARRTWGERLSVPGVRGARGVARAGPGRGGEGRHRALVEPVRAPAPGAGRPRRRLGRRAAADGDVRVGDRTLHGLRAARHGTELRQQVLLEVGCHRPGGAARAVPQRRARVSPVRRPGEAQDPDHRRVHARRLVVRRALRLGCREARRRLAARGGDRRPARVRDRHRAQHHQAEPRGAHRARGGLDPDRRAGCVHRARRARGVRGELQRERGGAGLLLLDPPLLLGLRPLLPRHRGHERLPPVLRRVRERRRARARHERRRAARLPRDRAVPRPAVRAGARRGRPRHPHGLRRAARARPRPDPPRRRRLRWPRAHPRDARLRPSHAELGGRVREAANMVEGTRLAEQSLNGSHTAVANLGPCD